MKRKSPKRVISQSSMSWSPGIGSRLESPTLVKGRKASSRAEVQFARGNWQKIAIDEKDFQRQVNQANVDDSTESY